MPKVSVLLPVYNGETYLHEAVDSVLQQTFTDFELIIINDGSRDNSAECIAARADTKIRYFEQPNAGLAATLNRAVSLAQGEYLARLDQDDIALPDRLAKQVDFLDAHPNCGMVGTWAEIFAETEAGLRYHKHPTDSLTLKLHLHFRNPFVHSSMMLRAATMRAIGGYTTDPQRQPPEDYELWSRMARTCDVANIGEVLMRYRETPTSMSRVEADPFTPKVYKIACENVSITLAGKKEARAGEALAGLLTGYRIPQDLPSAWKGIEAAMRAIVSQLCLGSPADESRLQREGVELLAGWRESLAAGRVPKRIRNMRFYQVIKPGLKRLYKAHLS